MSETPNSSTDNPHTQERKPIWEADWRLWCPIVGTCLRISEQRRILKKAGVPLDGLSNYDVHSLLVQSVGSEGPFSRRVQRYLDSRYRRQVTDFGTCPEGEFLSLWQGKLKVEEIEGLLWVGATNPNLSEQATGKVFADVHMLMHHQGELARKESQQARRLRAENQKLAGRLRNARKRARETTKGLRASEKARAQLQRTIRSLRAENDELKHAAQKQQQAESLRSQLEKTEHRLRAQTAVLDRVRTENGHLAAKLASQVEINQLMQAEIERLLREMLLNEAECETCPNRDLCAQRVLLVGGITKLRAFYQGLVEKMDGEFRYHDGCSGGGEQKLKGMIRWADVILCPVDVNSHQACLSVKKICKKMSKPYHMLPSSSVSSISRALADVAESCTLNEQV